MTVLAASRVDLLPGWLRWLWVAVYAAILVVHLRHAAAADGRRRGWHSVHTLMALGMLAMFLPPRLKPQEGAAGADAYAAAAAALAVWIGVRLARRRRVDLLWLVGLADTLAMVYMFALPAAAITALTAALAGYFAAEAAGWTAGAFDGDGPLRRRVGRAREPRPAEQLLRRSTFELRATLAAMALGMGYMLVAMQLAH